MNKKNIVIAVVVIAALALGFAAGSRQFGMRFGAVNIENYNPAIMANGYNSAKPITLSGADGDITSGDDITAGDDLTVTDDAVVTDDMTVSGGLFTLTTSNTATSSAVMGCIQTYATSTATAIRIGIGTLATTSPLSSGGNSVGHVLWQYGTCPF